MEKKKKRKIIKLWQLTSIDVGTRWLAYFCWRYTTLNQTNRIQFNYRTVHYSICTRTHRHNFITVPAQRKAPWRRTTCHSINSRVCHLLIYTFFPQYICIAYFLFEISLSVYNEQLLFVCEQRDIVYMCLRQLTHYCQLKIIFFYTCF